MELLTPWGLLALGALVPVVALYFRRRQRVRREVGSLELWLAVQRDLAHQAGLRRIRSESSLWLHLLALALVALGLAAPFRRTKVAASRRLVLVVDTTASMGATDGRRTRLDDARAVARQALAEVSRDGEVALIESGCVPALVIPLTRDAREVVRALDRLSARDCGGDLSRALALAADRLRGPGRDKRVVVITDGTTRADAVGVSLPGRLDVRVVGRDVSNTGVTAAELRADVGGSQSPDAARRFGLFVALYASGGEARDVSLRAELLRGERAETVALRRVRVSPGRSSVTLPVDLAADEAADLLRVTVERDGGQDALAVDDVAWAAVPPPRRLPVRLVVASLTASPWVARALRSDPSVALETLTPAEWASRRAQSFDGLTVFHGTAPTEALAGEVLAFDSPAHPVSPLAGVALGESVAHPRWTDVSPVDARVRFVGVADVHVPSARRVVLAPGDIPLVTSSGGALIVARDTSRGSTTLVAFDPDRTDWPLRPGFVLFVRDAVEHARERLSSLGFDARRAGSVIRIPSPVSVRVRGPVGGDAREVTLAAHDGVAEWVTTDRAGVYTLDRGRGTERVGLSLFDPTETALVRAELPWRGAVTQPAGTSSWETRDLAWAFALAALAVLLVEWWLHSGARLRKVAAGALVQPFAGRAPRGRA